MVKRATMKIRHLEMKVKEQIFKDPTKFGSPLRLKATVLPTVIGHTTQLFVLVDPKTQICFVCTKCKSVMQPITWGRKCARGECTCEKDKKNHGLTDDQIKARFARSVPRVRNFKKKEGEASRESPGGGTGTQPKTGAPKKKAKSNTTNKKKELTVGDKVKVPFYNKKEEEWYSGVVTKVNKVSFRVGFEVDGTEEKILFTEKWQYDSDEEFCQV